MAQTGKGPWDIWVAPERQSVLLLHDLDGNPRLTIPMTRVVQFAVATAMPVTDAAFLTRFRNALTMP